MDVGDVGPTSEAGNQVSGDDSDPAQAHERALRAYVDANKAHRTVSELLSGDGIYDAVITDLSVNELEALVGGSATIGDETIRCTVSPFGGSVSRKERDGTSLTTYALSGLTALNGYPDREPLAVWGYQMEQLTGMQAFSLLAGALRLPPDRRPRHVDIAGYEVAASLDYSALPAWSYTGNVRTAPGRNIGRNHPVTPLKCADGTLFLNCVTQDQWERLATLVELPDLIVDPRFGNSAQRREHADELNELIEPWFAAQSVVSAVEHCQTWRIPCAPFRSVQEARENAQLSAREFFDWASESAPVPFSGKALPDVSPQLRRRKD